MSKSIHWQRGVVLVIGLLTLFVPPLTFGAERDIVKFQGIVMELDWKKRMIVVNERVFTLDRATTVYNEKGAPVPQDNLKIKTWVYIEGIKDKNQKRLATKIYVLPNYVDEKEKALYPFIK